MRHRLVSVLVAALSLFPVGLYAQEEAAETYAWPTVGAWTEWSATTDYLDIDRFSSRRGIQSVYAEPRLSLEPQGLREFRYGLPGRARLTPTLVVEEAVTDNLFLQPNSEKEADLVNRISPGVRLDLKMLNYSVRLGYAADATIYSRFSDHSHVNQITNFDIIGMPLTNVRWYLSNIFLMNTELAVSPDDEDAFRYDEFISLGLTLDYNSKLRQDVQVFDEIGLFPQREFRDSSYNDFAVRTRLSYLLFPKTRVFSEFQFDLVTNEVSATSNRRYRVGGGFSWVPTGKIRGEMGAGYQWIVYQAQPMNQGLSVNGALEYAYSPRTVFGLAVMQEMTQTNSAAQNVQSGQSYQTSSVILGMSHNLRHNLTFMANGFWSTDNYGFQGDPQLTGGSDRSDTLYGYRLGLNWAPSASVLLGLSYQFQKSESKGEDTSDDNGFQENLVALRLTLAF